MIPKLFATWNELFHNRNRLRGAFALFRYELVEIGAARQFGTVDQEIAERARDAVAFYFRSVFPHEYHLARRDAGRKLICDPKKLIAQLRDAFPTER